MPQLTKADWRSQATRKTPRTVTITSLNADVLIRPMRSSRLFELEQQFPVDEDTGRILDYPAYMRAVIADSVVDADGNPIWTLDEVANDLDTEAFWELWEEVGTFLGLKKRKDAPKKS